MRYAVAVLLLMGCGPTPEEVGCCECLAETTSPLFGAGSCVAEDNSAVGIEQGEDAYAYCVEGMGRSDGFINDWSCWDAEQGAGAPCASACEGSREGLLRRAGR
jgi:hypothetical protein